MLAYEKAKMPGMADPKAVFAPFVEKDGRLWHPSDISIRTKELDVWKGYNRIQPMTAVSSGLLATQEIDFQIGSFMSTGYLDDLAVEITITEGNTGNAQFNIYDVFAHIDIQDLTGAIYKQLYPDEMFLSQVLYRDTDGSYRFNNFEGLAFPTFVPLSPTVAQNTSYQFVIPIPVFMNQFVDLRLLKSPLMIRCYMNNAASIAYSGTSTNLLLTSINLLAKEIQLPKLSYSKCLNFKSHNWVRNVQSIALQPSNTYDIKLNTFTGNAKYMFVLLRPSPTANNANNLHNYALGSHFSSAQINDSNSNIIGVSFNMNENKFITSKDFNSLFLVQPNTNIFVFNFALNAQGGSGQYMGGLQFSSNEFFHFTTDSTLSSGTYEITLWAVNQEMFAIHPDGSFTYTK
jgi:hypothetical protein